MKKLTFTIIIVTLTAAGCAASKKNPPSRAVIPAADETAAPPVDKDLGLLEQETTEQQVRISDPLHGWNRATHNFNDKLYFWVLKPVAKAWKKTVPKPARISIGNFFKNLGTPARYVSCLLQGKRRAAGTELHRFAYNTTVGVLGLGDPARDKLGLEPADEDLGQTLARWRVGNGAYLVLPLLGPSTVRDTVGLVAVASSSILSATWSLRRSPWPYPRARS